MTALKKYTYKDSRGNTSGYYIGYTSVYTNGVYATENEAIRNAMKKLGGADWIYEVRFRLDCKSFTKRNAFYEQGIGHIDNYRVERPIYESILAGRVHKRYLLSKDGRKIKTL